LGGGWANWLLGHSQFELRWSWGCDNKIEFCIGTLAWVVFHFLLKTISPNPVSHVNRYYKTPGFFSEFSGENWEAADHLCKYKGFSEKYKGKMSPTFFLPKRDFVILSYSSTLGTSLLMSRRVDRHPSWNFCMHGKLHAQLHAHAILLKIACACNFSTFQNIPWWVSINSSGHQ
jgi:hypothetical protein